MVELDSLRKMVPRLINQTEDLQARLDGALDPDYVWKLFAEGLRSEEETDNAYLEIIDMLLEESGTPPPFNNSSVLTDSQK